MQIKLKVDYFSHENNLLRWGKIAMSERVKCKACQSRLMSHISSETSTLKYFGGIFIE